MCAYTITICKNETNFPKRDRWILTQQITNEAIDAYKCIRRANAINVGIPEDYSYRRAQQKEAYSHCEALLALIDIAYITLHIDPGRVEYWTGLVLDTEHYLLKWHKADAVKYLGEDEKTS